MQTRAIVRRRPSVMAAVVEREDVSALMVITVALEDPQVEVGTVLSLDVDEKGEVVAWRVAKRRS